MAGSLSLTLSTDLSQSELQQIYKKTSGEPKEQCRALAELFMRIAGGVERAYLRVATGGAAQARASGTFTLASVIATDVVVVAGTTFTFTSSPSLSTDVEVDGADDTADALALATAINAHATVSQYVTASADAAVVTITANQPGVIGNLIDISSPDSTITESGAKLTGGTGGTAEEPTGYDLGLSA